MRTFKREKQKLLKFNFVFAENPQKSESAVKKNQANYSFKMFLLLTVWYDEEGRRRGAEPRGSHKNKN